MKKSLLVGLSGVLGLFLMSVSIPKLFNGATGGAEAISEDTGQSVPNSYQQGFELQILMNGYPLEEYRSRGTTYIEATPGAEYTLRIRNPLPYRVAVAVSVDGLNSIDARHTTAWNASKWVLEPYESIDVSGWQMSSNRARHFYFTSEQDSYGAKLGQTSNLGVISAVFFKELRPRPVPIAPSSQPAYEDNEARDRKSESPSANTEGSVSAKREPTPREDDDYAATGIGRSVRNDVTWIKMDLDRQPAAQLTIRYEYYSALVRLGVLPRQPMRPDALRRREDARGFEERRYSPEP